MPQVQVQQQIQTEAQLLKLSPLQLETAKLLELSIPQLEERVEKELIENNILEAGSKGEGDNGDSSSDTTSATDYEDDEYGRDDEPDRNDNDSPDSDSPAFDDYDSDDIPIGHTSYQTEEREVPLGDTISFIDDLLSQMSEMNLTEQQQILIEYLIGSLDDNGFIDAPLSDIVDDMLFHHNIYTDETELEEAITILQQFEPPGIGARNSKESLLLQIDRKMNDKEHLLGDKYFLLEDARVVISDYYDLFLNNNIEKIQNLSGFSPSRMKQILHELRKLNLRPGLSLCEAASDRIASAIPDFIVETTSEGEITMSLNYGELPPLRVSNFYKTQLRELESKDKNKRKSNAESAKFIRGKIESAQLFIDAIKLRQHTLTTTMRAIIELQHDFMLSQDPDDLRRLILKDVADKAGIDISTVSRVCNNKYCLLDGRLYQLSRFFKRSRSNSEGEDVDADKVRKTIQYIVSKEDKRKPFTDEIITRLLAKANINIKRRTVAKYRDELGIPIAKNRKSI